MEDKELEILKKEYARMTKNHPGIKHYLRFLNGEKLTRMEAMLAKCTECTFGYEDGTYDCEVDKCPLYEYMPFRGKFSKEQQERREKLGLPV